MLAPIPQQDAGHLDQPQVVRRLLLVTEPGWPDTSRASPVFAPLPIASPDSVSRPHHLPSPRRYAGCEGRSADARALPEPALCRSPSPGTGAHEALARWVRDAPPRWLLW